MGLFPFWPPEGADVEVDFFEAGEPPLLLELLLKSLLKNEFFLSKLFELEPLLTTLDCADAVEEDVVVGPPCKNLTHFISEEKVVLGKDHIKQIVSEIKYFKFLQGVPTKTTFSTASALSSVVNNGSNSKR